MKFKYSNTANYQDTKMGQASPPAKTLIQFLKLLSNNFAKNTANT